VAPAVRRNSWARCEAQQWITTAANSKPQQNPYCSAPRQSTGPGRPTAVSQNVPYKSGASPRTCNGKPAHQQIEQTRTMPLDPSNKGMATLTRRKQPLGNMTHGHNSECAHGGTPSLPEGLWMSGKTGTLIKCFRLQTGLQLAPAEPLALSGMLKCPTQGGLG